MTKKKPLKVGTLLAVTLATTAPVLAEPVDSWAPTPNVTVVPPNMPQAFRDIQAGLLIDSVLATLGMTAPRQLSSGAPACGNVQAKMPASRRAQCSEPLRTASTERR